ncbi:EpsG family protein [Geotalea uraniireducens]|nr:EpsG family protein [Geotalea uraniireducens]
MNQSNKSKTLLQNNCWLMVANILKASNIEIICIVVFGTILIATAGLQLFGPSADYYAYQEMVIDKTNVKLDTVEFAFRALLWINDILFGSDFQTFLVMFAILGVSIKLFALLKYSKIPLLSLILYAFSYYLLHEYIQIRAGVATGIFLLALSDLAKGDAKRYFLKALLAILFHWSSVVLLPLYFIVRYVKIGMFYLLPFIGILLFINGVNVDLVTPEALLPIEWLSNYYVAHSGQQEEIKAFNLISISHVGLFLFVAVLYLRSKEIIDEFDLVLFKIFSISLFLFFFLSSFQLPVIAFRLNEYLNVVLLLLIPAIVCQSDDKLVMSILFIFYFMLYAYHLIFNVQAIPDLLIFFQII